ncbi:MAG: translocation/assembly module TamB [Pseudoflavonifractor sp.]|nr:translocation/assembly module TamB [Alloprevotella sp.]MCM1116661.1 translocation/assembly module TamB [Pseudoflavonifractor sp.]
MKIGHIYKTIRLIAVAALLTAVMLPASLYIALSLPWFQGYARREASQRLSELLGARVEIGSLTITPYSRVNLRGIVLIGEGNDTIATAQRLGAGLGLADLIFHGRIVLNYVEAIGLNAHIKRDSLGAPLNIDHIAKRLSRPGGDGGVPDLRINTIVVRQSTVTYDVDSEPWLPTGRLDKNHLRLTDVRADLRLRLDHKRRAIDLELSRLAAEETYSGLKLTDLSTKAIIHKAPAPSGAISVIELGNTMLEMPLTRLSILPSTINLADTLRIPVKIAQGSYITPADLNPLIPGETITRLETLLNSKTAISLSAILTKESAEIDNLSLSVADGAIAVTAPDRISLTLPDTTRAASIDIQALSLAFAPKAAPLLPIPIASAASARGDSLLRPLLPLILEIQGNGTPTGGAFTTKMKSSMAGELLAAIDYDIDQNKNATVKAHADIDGLNPASIAAVILASARKISDLPLKLPTQLTTTIDAHATLTRGGKIPNGRATAMIHSIDMPLRNGHITPLTDIALALNSDGGMISATIESGNEGAALSADIDLNSHDKSASFDIIIDDLDPTLLGLGSSQANRLSLTASCSGKMEAHDAPLPVTGTLALRDIRYGALALSAIDLNSSIPEDDIPSVTLTSDILAASIEGSIDPKSLIADLKVMMASALPELFPPVIAHTASRNNFSLKGRLLSSEPIEKIAKLPIQIRYPIDFSATLQSEAQRASLHVDAPYLWQGNKEIDSTSLSFTVSGPMMSLAGSTRMPTKNGPMRLRLTSALPAPDTLAQSPSTITTAITWEVESTRNFSGSIAFDTSPRRDPAHPGETIAEMSILPSSLIFNDTVWTVSPARIIAGRKLIEVDGFRVGHADQHIEINGSASPSPIDSITVSLADIDLDYVFETLNISNAMFGGIATGKLYAAGIMGKQMKAYTPDLFVKGLKYNFSLMGDTHIKASFDPETPAVNIQAKVDQPNGRNSYIDGYIKPTSEGYIDLNFTADRIQVGFMKPFMSAFASAVGGYASGNAHLFGTFHDVNMSGNIYAEDLSLTLDFTGVTYWATDSVHLSPGYIDLNGITLRDRDGNTARLGGYLRHTNFHEPQFQFRVTDAHNLLVYDLPESPDRRWFGTIFGDGNATVTGVPGHIDIGVEMTTAPNSSFTFILSDAEEAYDYRFITFRDRNASAADSLTDELINGIPREVVEMRRALAKNVEEESSSIYDMIINVRVNPNAMLTVVMDPIGGDAIKARGNGDMSMTYNSSSEDLGLRGDYTLDNGTYNFTFQDIIRKDFRINPGSTIRFTGDPYAAILDIEAAYRLTANLSDLDESFLDDPELTRTSVPVDALIEVSGLMTAPDIAYDLAFPTLKDDVKRKVNSIVSTDDMKARQMLYLLALNRFYTPEYMSATKGNELFSVASSTISSQISNLLGSLSDNWTISPNVRSDRGDFSDVEFDLALSSSLLNNRLLFNGNFGYRDKSLNTNTFIGDFDLEYLLNRSGSLRLKAYNRYNDQNFYVKNALTTQGVGIVFRRDFDSLTAWLRRLLHKPDKATPSSTKSEPTDSITHEPQQ